MDCACCHQESNVGVVSGCIDLDAGRGGHHVVAAGSAAHDLHTNHDCQPQEFPKLHADLFCKTLVSKGAAVRQMWWDLISDQREGLGATA